MVVKAIALTCGFFQVATVTIAHTIGRTSLFLMSISIIDDKQIFNLWCRAVAKKQLETSTIRDYKLSKKKDQEILKKILQGSGFAQS